MRRAPWGKAGALALAVLAHLALLLGAGRHGSMPRPKAPPQPAPVTLMVALLPDPPQPVTGGGCVAELVQPRPVAPIEVAAIGPAPDPAPEAPAVPEPTETPPQFFPLPELTSPPQVTSGLTRGDWLELPGTSGGYITVRFWINALGEVVRAQVVEVDGNSDDEEKLLPALRQIRFLPARIGHLAVASELKMELRVVRNAGL